MEAWGISPCMTSLDVTIMCVNHPPPVRDFGVGSLCGAALLDVMEEVAGGESEVHAT
jgi:hypothetical protein